MKLLIAFAFALILYLVQGSLYRRLWNKGLAASLSFSRDVVYEGQDNELVEIIENRKYLPIPILQVKFSITRTFLFEKQNNTNVTDKYYRSDFFTVMPWQKITRTYPFVCSRRGYFYTQDLDLIGRSLFLNEKMFETKSGGAGVCVLPGRIAHKDVPETVNNLLGQTEKNLRLNEDPFTFAGIRDYQPFDNMRSINWKVTARHGDLLVNTYNTTFSRKVVLLLNTESNGMLNTKETSEWAIKIAAHLASSFITARIPTALYTNARDVSVEVNYTAATGRRMAKDAGAPDSGCPAIEAGADLSHIRAIETALARLNTDLPPASFMSLLDERISKGREAVEYIIISNYRKKDIIDRYELLGNEGFGMHFVIPALPTEDVESDFGTDRYTLWRMPK